MTIANRLIILRDRFKLSQQRVADAIGVSKSTYCRFEKGSSVPGAEEINEILRLYATTYEEFMGMVFPIEHVVSYPEKLIINLRDAVERYGSPVDNYHMNYDRYYRIQNAMEPVLAIREEAMNLPDIDVKDIPTNTIVMKVNMDIRGEKLIEEGMNAQHKLFEAMQGYFDGVISDVEVSKETNVKEG